MSQRNQQTFKNHKTESALINSRIFIVCVFILIILSLLISRLAYLQIVKYDMYEALSNKNQIDIRPTPPARGLIYDRNGLVLARNLPVYSLDVTPSAAGNLWQSIEEIQKIIPISETEIKQFKRQAKQHRRFVEIPLKMRLTEEEAATFSVNQFRFKGFSIRARLIRDYPYGEAFAHIIGHVGRINESELAKIDKTNYSANNYIGKVGLEKYYEQQLHGKVGYEKLEVNASGMKVRSLDSVPPVSGDNLYLTIDSKLQLKAQEILADFRGSIVVIDPNNGEILAMASNPSYNPNLFVTGISSKDYQTLQNDENKPLYNRAIRGLYPIGSTIKPFIALSALDNNVMTATETIEDPGWYKLPGNNHIFHDWKHTGHGTVDMRKAIAVSCDTYFYEMARRLGIERIDNILQAFGFGQLTHVDMGEELSGNIPTPAWKEKTHGSKWYQGDTILTGIGQSYVQITPLNLASDVAGLSMRGERYRPHLLTAITDSEDEKLIINKVPLAPVVLDKKENWAIVIQGMKDVIDATYGYHFRFGKKPSYTVAGKTGTAQVVSLKNAKHGHTKIPEKFRDHSLFIGFAPVDKPKLAVAVIIENNPQAATMARKMMDYYLLKEGKLNEHQA